MSKYDLSILIPARNEEFLARTVEDILENKRGATEIIVGLDGEWANPPLPVHEDLKVLYVPESIGQRAMTNQLCRLSDAKYVAKTDAHCAFDEGFDVKLMAKMQDNYIMVPVMKNLHVFDWVCDECGSRWYQGQTPTRCLVADDLPKREKTRPNPNCDNTEHFHREMVWEPNPSPNSTSYRFDNTLHFQYFGQYCKRDKYKENKKKYGLTETMSLQGSFFMLTRENYWKWDICDEKHGSWGQQGTEVACKGWLSGEGRVVCNHDTWYAHLFRTQGGDFGFPYPNPGISHARKYSRDLWFNNKWDKAKHDVYWLVNKFAPVPGWDFTVGVLYYSTGEIDHPEIMEKCQRRLLQAIGNKRLVSCTLKPMPNFGDNIHLDLEPGYITLTKQLIAGLKELDTDIVYLAEHDVLYSDTHFDFVPPKKDVYYYNTNVWRVRWSDGHAVRTDDCRKLSQLVAYRETLLKHFEKRLELLENRAREVGEDSEEFRRYVRKMGFEPGTHNRDERVDKLGSDRYESKSPNVDIRDHGTNVTPSKWSPDQYRNKKYAKGWTESDTIPEWGNFNDFFKESV